MPIYLELTQIAWAEEKLSGLNVSTSYATKLIPSVRVNHHNFSLKRIKSGTSDVLSWHLSCLYLILLNKLQSVRTHLDQMWASSEKKQKETKQHPGWISRLGNVGICPAGLESHSGGEPSLLVCGNLISWFVYLFETLCDAYINKMETEKGVNGDLWLIFCFTGL